MSASTHECIVRPARAGDVENLLALYARVFARPLSREQFEWKLAGTSDVQNVWVAERDGRIVFQYAGIPTRFRHRGADVWAMVSVDTMADPDLRRRGLLTQVATVTYRHWRDAGIAFVMGLPNQQWGSRAAALGWTPIAELRWWVCWLEPLAVLAGRIGLRAPNAEARPVAQTVARPTTQRDPSDLRLIDDASFVDDLWPRIADEGVVRDRERFTWRYGNPLAPWTAIGLWRGGVIVGEATFRCDLDAPQPTGLIGEIVAIDQPARRALLAGVCNQLRARGARRAAVLIQSGSELEEVALCAQFLPRASTFVVQAVDLGGHAPRAARFEGADFDVL